MTNGARYRLQHHAEGSVRPLAPAPPAEPLPRRSEAEGGGGLVVLLLAERAPSEGPRSTRAIEDQPGHLLEKKQTSKLGETIVCRTRASGDKPRRSPPHPSVERVDPARRF